VATADERRKIESASLHESMRGEEDQIHVPESFGRFWTPVGDGFPRVCF
jgi:hypothetical protein